MKEVIHLDTRNAEQVARLAELTSVAFKETSPNWLPTLDAARDQVLACANQGQIARVCLAQGQIAGWIGVIQRRHLWEIHPIAVDPNHQLLGVGQCLVEDIAELAEAAGITTLLADTSDETGTTNLLGQDLYADPARAIRDLEATGRSPYRFWESVGFTVVGIVPDAEGPGKPGISLARKLQKHNQDAS